MEAVVWISAVTELLSAGWLLGIGLAWVSYLESSKRRWYVVALILTLGFLFTKEWSALTVPFLALLGTWRLANSGAWNRANIRRLFVRLAPFLAVFAGYFCFEFFLQHQQSPLIAKGYYVVGWHAVPNIAGNFLLSFVPLTEAAHQYPRLWLTASAAALLAAAFIGVRSWRRRRDSAPALCASWIIIAFVPTSFFTWDPFISRYDYLPALGVAVFLAVVLNYFTFAKQAGLRFAAVFLAAAYIGINIFFISKMTRLYYAPVHAENKKFTEAVAAKLYSLKDAGTLGIYPNTPHKSFILPEVLQALFDIPRKNIRVLAPETPCPEATVCLRWDPETKAVGLSTALTAIAELENTL